MIERDNENDDSTMVEIILPRVEDTPAMPEDFDMDERPCVECGSMVYYEPHPEIAESDAVIVCSRCRVMVLVGMDDTMCADICDCHEGTIEAEIALPGQETASEIRRLLN